jgi:hypothetical protein
MHQCRSIPLLCLSLCLTTSAFAGLKEKAPKGFDAAATGTWQIDMARSDDPKVILDKAREKMARSRGGAGRSGDGGFGGPGMGGRGGGRGPGGGPGGGGPGGGGPAGGSRGGGDRGGMPPGGPSRDGAPAGAQLLDDLAISPSSLSITRADQRVKVLTAEHSVNCMAGTDVAISDASGSGQRQCGWSGAAWVVETTRGNDFERTDRYEPAPDGNTLTYSTKISSQRLGLIKIVRVYVRSQE